MTIPHRGRRADSWGEMVWIRLRVVDPQAASRLPCCISHVAARWWTDGHATRLTSSTPGYSLHKWSWALDGVEATLYLGL
jgi:hypothetical protein